MLRYLLPLLLLVSCDSINPFKKEVTDIKSHADAIEQKVDAKNLSVVKPHTEGIKQGADKLETLKAEELEQHKAEEQTKADIMYWLKFLVPLGILGSCALAYMRLFELAKYSAIVSATSIAVITWYDTIAIVAGIGLGLVVLKAIATQYSEYKKDKELGNTKKALQENIELMQEVKQELPVESKQRLFSEGGTADTVQSITTQEMVLKHKLDSKMQNKKKFKS